MTSPSPVEARGLSEAWHRANTEVQRLIADQGIPAWSRAWYRGIYFARTDWSLEDLVELVGLLRRSQERAAAVSGSAA